MSTENQPEPEGQQIYIVCLREIQAHTIDSALRTCDICFGNVWCHPMNLLKIPICIKCALELPDPKFIIDRENLITAIEELKKRKNAS